MSANSLATLAVCRNTNYYRFRRVVQDYIDAVWLVRQICDEKLEIIPVRHTKLRERYTYQLAILEYLIEMLMASRITAATALALECRLDLVFESYSWLNSELATKHYRFVEFGRELRRKDSQR